MGKTSEDSSTGPKPDSDRLGSETRGLVEDVKTWVDLKLRLLQLDFEERIEGTLNRVAVAVVMSVLIFLTVLFGLLSLAFGLGSFWFSDTLGFLAVALLLFVATVTFRLMRPSLVRLRRLRDEEPAPGVAGPDATARIAATGARREVIGGSDAGAEDGRA